jgi:voltage-gated potassium channel
VPQICSGPAAIASAISPHCAGVNAGPAGSAISPMRRARWSGSVCGMATTKLRPPRWAWLRRVRLTPAGAIRMIAAVTLLVTVISGVAMHIVDRREFPTIGRSLWWAAQTVTTVGYGDVAPHATAGRIVGLAVMLGAITWVTLVTAAVTAILIDRSRGVPVDASDSPEELLVEMNERLARLESALRSGDFADATEPGIAHLDTKHEPVNGGHHGNHYIPS